MTEPQTDHIFAHSPDHLERTRQLLASANPAVVGEQMANACHTAALALNGPHILRIDRRAVRAVLLERSRQRVRWTDGHDDEHTAAEWATLIAYYASANALGGIASTRHGFIQAAAVALAAIQTIDREVDRMAGLRAAMAGPAQAEAPQEAARPARDPRAEPPPADEDTTRREGLRAEIAVAEAESRRRLADQLADILARHAAAGAPFIIDCRDL
ncbi:hypothetical protein SAMN02745172_02497 [Pseudoxanthobacter soli DSM 19599]|uniref:Uncharacterized protein n=1 Tax=Pseudoxanthobacter soli DSM 19599 TaxID=1123029 RepID=A0A1M7ZLS3_9HYPH|nr:hypothetical protein [Pseudoxanthobacter soli]SHO65850.1 hypothetical protein SAMN02745172_02497 [Pseudoxanthobacter soli DSM 19599]